MPFKFKWLSKTGLFFFKKKKKKEKKIKKGKSKVFTEKTFLGVLLNLSGVLKTSFILRKKIVKKEK